MNENNARSDSIGNENNWSEVGQIGDIFISFGWENYRTILILENRGDHKEGVEIRYQESQHPSTKLLNFFKQLPLDEPQKVPLPTQFEHWEKLHFNVGQNTPWSVPIKDLIIVLQKPRDQAKRQGKPEPLQRGFKPLSPKLERSTDPEKSPRSPSFQAAEQQSSTFTTLDETLAEVKRKSRGHAQLSTEPEQQRNFVPSHEKSLKQLDHEIQDQKENIIPQFQNKITQLERTVTECQKVIDSLEKQKAGLSQENSKLERQLNTQKDATLSDPEQVFREAAHRTLQTLFGQHQKDVGETLQDPIQICQEIETEIKKFEERFDGQMIYALSVAREYITKVKGLIHFELSELSSPEEPWGNQSEQLAQLVLMDEPPDEVQFPYLGELGKIYWNDLKAFTTNMPQVILETQALLHRIVLQLLDGFSAYRAKTAKEEQMSRCFYEDYLPNILKIMNLELVPIEIGQTEADSRIHDIQGSQRGAYQRGVVADIIQHGVCRISDKQIIRKPVVMRGEPE